MKVCMDASMPVFKSESTQVRKYTSMQLCMYTTGANLGQTGHNGAKQGQTGSNGAEQGQIGPNGAKQGQTGPNGAKWGKNRAK